MHNTIDLLAENDPLYQEMLLRCRLLEKQFDAIVQTLTTSQQNTVWDFVMLCEAMSERKLELACTYLSNGGTVNGIP